MKRLRKREQRHHQRQPTHTHPHPTQVHSLYSNADIFLRELISNASDALDKIRFLSLTDKKALAAGPDLEIRVRVDPDARVLEIRDTGVGMTRADLVSNLGTIAKSGTSAFLDTLAKGGGDSMAMIGQFGVGFYSVYLVADRVQVVSKHNDDPIQWVWESAADGAFTVAEDKEGDKLGRGTAIRIHLREDKPEYADPARLKALVAKYSEFVGHPIYLYSSTEETKEVEEEDKAGGDDDVVSDADDDSTTTTRPKTKTVTETKWAWERLNDVAPVWLRAPSDVSDADHTAFYRAIAKTVDTPLARAHFRAEGDVEFKALLYVPGAPPPGFYEK